MQRKQAEAQAVLTQINAMDTSLGKAVERYNLANVRLAQIRADLKENSRELKLARANLKIGQQRIARRVVELYTSTGGTGTMDVILGAQSLDDLLNRLDTVNRVSSLDAKVVNQVRTFREATKRHAKLLSAARAAQEQVVAQRAAEKQSIESQLQQRQRLLSSIKGEIAQLKAQEQAQQALLARQARARYAASQAAARAGSLGGVVGASTDTPGGVPGDTALVPPSQYSGVVGVAMQQLGKPYVWAAAGPDTFDCSGLVVYSFAQLGVSLPHSSYALWGAGAPVSADQLQPGDLVFFDGLGHVGIYIGGGEFIHAPHTGDVVKISSLSEYGGSYVGARRIG